MKLKYKYTFITSLFIIDIFSLYLSIFFSIEWLKSHNFNLNNLYFRQVIYFILSCWFASAGLYRLYYTLFSFTIETIYRNTWKTYFLNSILLFLLLSIEIRNTSFLNFYILFLFIFFSCLSLTRFLLTILYFKFINIKTNTNLIGIIGFNTLGIKLSQYFESHPYDYNYKGILDDNVDSTYLDKMDLNNHVTSFIKLAFSKNINIIYITILDLKNMNTKNLFHESEKYGINLNLVYDFDNSYLSYHSTFKDGFNFISYRNVKLEQINSRIYKRLFDIIFSILVIIFILIWLYPILWVIIKIQSPGPTLFKQKRNGRNNAEFTCFKFRSMHINNLSDVKQAEKNDNRFFPLGAFMRRTNLDELPQFFNVLIGEMSVVGPRPHMLKHTHEFSQMTKRYMIRHLLKPGITGWAQVNGRDELNLEQKVALEKEYLAKKSLFIDFQILIKTFTNVLFSKGVTH
jgi:undecaprenyl-phosphate galactose phosphotransferase/putative colanic acid biosynthesis UDP-glucose lipid carrier transferase